MVIVAYISGHGFGHFTRSAAVLEALVARGVQIHLRTSERALLLGRAASWPASVGEVDVGPGIVQRGPLAIDREATRAALRAHLAAWPEIVEEEAGFAVAAGARLIFSDCPPVAFPIAARAQIPSFGLGNFSWSWIYQGHDFSDEAGELARAESQATLFGVLEMGGGLEVFPRRVELPPVARRPLADRATIRAQLPFPADDRPLVLLSFGGFGDEFPLGAIASPRHKLLVVSAPVRESDDVKSIRPTPSLPHHELVAAADCVIGKPGYGTVAECLARGTPLAYVPRGLARELPVMIAAIERWLPSAPLDPEDLAAGRWGDAVDRAIAGRPSAPPPTGNGIEEAVHKILALMG